MLPRILDPKMIENICDVVEKKKSKMSSQFEAQLEAILTNQVKEGRVEFCRYLRSWSLPIRKRVVWPVRRLV